MNLSANFELRICLASGSDRPLAHNDYQMGSVFRTTMDVTIHVLDWKGNAVQSIR